MTANLAQTINSNKLRISYTNVFSEDENVFEIEYPKKAYTGKIFLKDGLRIINIRV